MSRIVMKYSAGRLNFASVILERISYDTFHGKEVIAHNTALVIYECGGKDGVDSSLLYYVPKANAVVSTGSRDRWIELSEAERIIGPYEEIRVLSYPGAPSIPAHRAMTLDARDTIIGDVDNWGSGAWTCK